MRIPLKKWLISFPADAKKAGKENLPAFILQLVRRLDSLEDEVELDDVGLGTVVSDITVDVQTKEVVAGVILCELELLTSDKS